MITLSDKESLNYVGGAKITAGLVMILAAVGSFILGLIDGFSNPKACNAK